MSLAPIATSSQIWALRRMVASQFVGWGQPRWRELARGAGSAAGVGELEWGLTLSTVVPLSS